jgi:hypothetical protein
MTAGRYSKEEDMCPFTEWLHHWQELVGAIVGAIAVTSTVWWTLSAERRKRDKETHAMRVALGAEVRQFAHRALQACQSIVTHWETAMKNGTSSGMTPVALENIARFPDPVIYPNTVAGLGSLGEHAHLVVFFFNQISMVRGSR